MQRVMAVLWAGLLAVGCSTTIRPSEVRASDTAYGELLALYVDAAGRVDYAGLSADTARLQSAYAHIAAMSPDSDPEAFAGDQAALAWWIDAYNLAVLVGVVQIPVEETVLEVPPPLLLRPVLPDGAGFFYFTEFVFGGESLSLYDVEHDIIRGRFGDARIHFAINCASASCPRLQSRPWSSAVSAVSEASGVPAGTLDARLDAAAREFVADPEQVRIDVMGRRVSISPIFDWFSEDFGPPLPYLIRYASGERLDQLRRARDEGWELDTFDYDWSLNGRRDP